MKVYIDLYFMLSIIYKYNEKKIKQINIKIKNGQIIIQYFDKKMIELYSIILK